MTIKIIRVFTVAETETRHADFIIDNGDEAWYRWSRGGLSPTNGVLAMLEAEESTLYAAAVAAGNLATNEEIAQAKSRAWFVANSGAVSAIFGSDVETLNTNVATLMTALFPSATANQRTQMRYALMSGLLTCRCYANGGGIGQRGIKKPPEGGYD